MNLYLFIICYNACRNEGGSDWWNTIIWQVSKQCLPWPSASVRSSSAKANIRYWLAYFCTLGWKQIRLFPSYSYLIHFALPKERKDYVGLRTPWEHPCRFDSCMWHHSNLRSVWYMVLDLFCLPYFKALFILVPWIFTANIGNKIPQMLETKNHKSWKQKAENKHHQFTQGSRKSRRTKPF